MFPLNVRNQVTHPHKTFGKIRVLYTVIFMFLDSRWEDKNGSGLNGNKHYQNSISSQFPSESNFDMLLLFPNTGNVSYFQKICLLSLCNYSDSNIYIVFSAFTSRPSSLLASIKVYVFFSMVSMSSPSRYTLSAQARS
jgi:hypothetical protein